MGERGRYSMHPNIQDIIDTTGHDTRVVWTKGHLAELNKVFPEVYNTNCTNELLVQSGRRAVVHYVRDNLLNKNRSR